MLRALGTYPLGTLPLGYTPAPAAPPALLCFEDGLAAWAGDKLGVNFYAHTLPDDATLPCFAFNGIDGDSPPLLTGPNGFAWTLMQFDAYSDVSPAEAEALQRRLYDALTGYQPQVGDATGVVALPRRKHSGSELVEGDTGGSSARRFRQSRDYRISWSDPAPAGPS